MVDGYGKAYTIQAEKVKLNLNARNQKAELDKTKEKTRIEKITHQQSHNG